MKVFKPPIYPPLYDRSIFLAGSIEMGNAEKWQEVVAKELSGVTGIILDPRRDDWDSSWEQSKDNPDFRGQVEWELNMMEKASFVALYFDPNTKAAISLLELGYQLRSKKIVVACPEGFWRKGNVDIVCGRFGIPQVPDLDSLIESIKKLFL